jgi:L-ribulose-5-phosphate 3-epimerase
MFMTRPETRTMNQTITRREALVATTALGISALAGHRPASAAENARTFKIGACDWSIGKRGDVASLSVAKEIGLDGVQVSFGPPGDGMDLRKEEVRRRYLEASQETGIAICSLAMGVLNQVPYASSDDAERWVAECIEVMPKLNQKVVLLAFFGKGDIHEKPDLQKEVIRRLKRVAPQAEKAGVVLGIESWMNVTEHLAILDGVGSPAVQVYYDVANMEKQGYDLYQEIRQLGRDRICEIHCKENGFLLGQGKIDFPKVKAAIDEIGWSGWLVVESAIPPGTAMLPAYQKNQKFLRSVFPTGA